MGSVVAQGCHAAVAAIHTFSEASATKSYLEGEALGRMRKVVLEVKDEAQLLEYKDKLNSNNIDFHLWIEQPENIPSCLALRPYEKEELGKLLRGLKLFK